LFFYDFSASVSIFFAPSTSFSVRRAARYRSRRLGAPFTFAPPGPVTSTAFGFSSLVSISYSTSSPYERVITIRHRQSRARALKKFPRWVSAPAPPPRPAEERSRYALNERTSHSDRNPVVLMPV